MHRTTRPLITRCLHRLTLAAALALAIPATALAQRQMHWDRLDVSAHLDANGALTVTETQTVVFTGDWNGGERRFDVRGRQRLRFLGMSRLEDSRRIGLAPDDRIDNVDEYALPEANLLRWRSRRSTDPPFSRTPIRYELRYVLSNVLKQDGERYRLDHDFAFPDRSGVIEQFTVRLTVDPVWALPADFPERHTRNNLSPRTGFVLHVPLTYTGPTPPVVEPTRPRAIVIGVCVLFGITTLAVLGFFIREERAGRFEPLTEAIDEPWLRDHVLRYPAEIVGAAWDESIDKPEVVALLARLVAEGVLESEVSHRSLLLRLKVDRSTLSGYTRTLVDRLFFDERTETSPEIVSERYRDEGFNPVHVIRRDLQAAVDEVLPPPPAPGLSRAVSVGLFALGFVLLGLAIAIGDIRPGHAFFGVIATFVVIAIGAATGLTGRTQLEWGRRAALFSLAPALAVAAAAAAGLWFFGGPDSAALRPLSVAAIVTLALAVTNSLINTLKSRQHPDAMRFRKNLTAARAYFATQLESRRPDLRAEWYPWLLAFGLEWEPESWSTAPRRVEPDERRRRYTRRSIDLDRVLAGRNRTRAVGRVRRRSNRAAAGAARHGRWPPADSQAASPRGARSRPRTRTRTIPDRAGARVTRVRAIRAAIRARAPPAAAEAEAGESVEVPSSEDAAASRLQREEFGDNASL